MSKPAKIMCHADGNRCHGCAHYWGKSDICTYAPEQQEPERLLCNCKNAEECAALGEALDGNPTDEWCRQDFNNGVYAGFKEQQEPSANGEFKEAKEAWRDPHGCQSNSDACDYIYELERRIEELEQIVTFYATKIADNGILITELHQERQFWEIANPVARIGEAKDPKAIAKRVSLIERTIEALNAQ